MVDITYLRPPTLPRTFAGQTKGNEQPMMTLCLLSLWFRLIQNILNVKHTEMANRMLVELMEVAKLSWTIACGAFAASMHKIEECQISLLDTRVLSDNRLIYSQVAVLSGSTTVSLHATHSSKAATNVKKVVCKRFNEGTCPHQQDHMDSTGTTQFRHICMFCFKFLKRSNIHTESDCLNEKKPGTID